MVPAVVHVSRLHSFGCSLETHRDVWPKADAWFRRSEHGMAGRSTRTILPWRGRPMFYATM
eukprot:5176632-Prorocentrum_lima.AAC.1